MNDLEWKSVLVSFDFNTELRLTLLFSKFIKGGAAMALLSIMEAIISTKQTDFY
ncbi:hypothetical protein SBF1_1160016 [Candidatus Desulfosporosinus infrequens]|uniref:Uncharacterized protein n=1 Tax=Candidatus Desulfosporosinus infrequens TaxID=2043169 RepID=A0A2U3JZH9_9FIRM|nr:hypothetical protein SBF1_1160016 [Candidatus Desulfosporosinus infrequens]